ncbi:uncharacterized protein EI90DRAFT_3048106 [Cantharellus anzutake]|uniref:uncharacterized protein n=1 Tax=Cantharellus anzutake TaxID=1750568 RepID=UPI001904AB6D|nr:uncharacterized protein EI90DRAFT_3048106 [Cantharellus anzutake]KAF8335378.1 hypothetical protein EI90DRAFT_3048106 [Cantharellus anzutake]
MWTTAKATLGRRSAFNPPMATPQNFRYAPPCYPYTPPLTIASSSYSYNTMSQP